MTDVTSTDNVLSHEPGIIELTEFELGEISGGGWFEKAFGFSTPSFLKRLDDKVNELPGGWLGLVATLYTGGAVGGVKGVIGAGLTHMH